MDCSIELDKKEIWKPIGIKHLKKFYDVSNKGRIRSKDRIVLMKDGRSRRVKGRAMYQTKGKDGYMRLILARDALVFGGTVHKFVALTFLKRKADNLQVNHKNGNKQDNRVENLEWITRSKNQLHSHRVLCTKAPTKKVLQYSKDGELLKCWSSQTEASLALGIRIGGISISACCGNRTAGGFIWRHDESEMHKFVRKNHYRCAKVRQFSKDGDFIKEWPSIKEAAAFVRISAAMISANCRNRIKSAAGFIWRYVDEEQNGK